jgi:hypothetical protein
LASQERRLNPFVKIGCSLERGQRQLPHALVCDALGQSIDRFADGDVCHLAHVDDLGMDDLEFLAPGIELANDNFASTTWELFPGPTGIVEKCKCYRVFLSIAGINPQG